MTIPQREHWVGEPVFLGDAWRLNKKQHVAKCALLSHQFGWELRLTIGELLRTQVCRSSDDVIRVQEEWRRALEERGYAGPTNATEGA